MVRVLMPTLDIRDALVAKCANQCRGMACGMGHTQRTPKREKTADNMRHTACLHPCLCATTFSSTEVVFSNRRSTYLVSTKSKWPGSEHQCRQEQNTRPRHRRHPRHNAKRPAKAKLACSGTYVCLAFLIVFFHEFRCFAFLLRFSFVLRFRGSSSFRMMCFRTSKHDIVIFVR